MALICSANLAMYCSLARVAPETPKGSKNPLAQAAFKSAAVTVVPTESLDEIAHIASGLEKTSIRAVT
jgi:hypothetical protein